MRKLSTEMDSFVKKTHLSMLENMKNKIDAPKIVFSELSPTNFYRITMERVRQKPDFIRNPLEVDQIIMNQNTELEYCYCLRFNFDESWMNLDESVRRPKCQKNYSKFLTTGKDSSTTANDRYMLVCTYDSNLTENDVLWSLTHLNKNYSKRHVCYEFTQDLRVVLPGVFFISLGMLPAVFYYKQS